MEIYMKEYFYLPLEYTEFKDVEEKLIVLYIWCKREC